MAGYRDARREAAREAKQTTYFGDECEKHPEAEGVRYVTSNGCVSCAEEKTRERQAPQPSTGSSDDLRRAEIIQKGRTAEREINGAVIAAQQAWQNWRMHGTYVTKDGHVAQKQEYAAKTERAYKQGVMLPDGTREEGVYYERLTGEMHPDLQALQSLAEAADRHVLALKDDIAIATALRGVTRK